MILGPDREMRERRDRGIMWITFGHLRPSSHIMPDHVRGRGAVFLVLAPHEHPACQADGDVYAGLRPDHRAYAARSEHPDLEPRVDIVTVIKNVGEV
jgi:hypothetical protein